MKKLFGFIAFLGILLSLTYTGCRKGEEDPFLSLRSRNKRIVGTWLLKSGSDVVTTTTTTTDYNNVNAEKTTVAETKTESSTFDGTVFTMDETTTTTTTDLTTDAVLNTSTGKYTYNTTTEVVVENTNVVDKNSFSIELEINEDHTYNAKFTQTRQSHHTSGSQTVGGINTPYTSTDTTYSPADTRIWVEEGDWYWEDANDQKIMIVAGNVMNGKLKRLSNKEIILEDITEDSDDNTINTTKKDYSDAIFYIDGILTYKDASNPYRDTTGVLINHVVETVSRNYTSTWAAK